MSVKIVTSKLREKVKGLLVSGTRINVVAKTVGISRNTVYLIRVGKYDDLIDDYTRCPGCGGMVTNPCLLCEINRSIL